MAHGNVFKQLIFKRCRELPDSASVAMDSNWFLCFVPLSVWNQLKGQVVIIDFYFTIFIN